MLSAHQAHQFGVLLRSLDPTAMRTLVQELHSLVPDAVADDQQATRVEAFLAAHQSRPVTHVATVLTAAVHEDSAFQLVVVLWFQRAAQSWTDYLPAVFDDPAFYIDAEMVGPITRTARDPLSSPGWTIRLEDLPRDLLEEPPEPTGNPDSPGWAPPPEEEPTGGPPGTRYLSASLPDQVDVGWRFALVVRVSRNAMPGTSFVGLRSFEIPPAGITATITVVAPSLVALSPLDQDVEVPADEDSEPCRFGFSARTAGVHEVEVLAYLGGTFLGRLTTQILVQTAHGAAQDKVASIGLGPLRGEPGEVTLQVSPSGDGRYSFHLIGDQVHKLANSERLAGDPGLVVERIVGELCDMATGESPYEPAEQPARLRNLGIRLWAEAVPEAVRRQFWTHRTRITAFTVISAVDNVPWELLYPLDAGQPDHGFLVEQMPVVRRVPDGPGARRMVLDSSAFVVPPYAPTDALDEIGSVRTRLGRGVADRGVVQHRRDLGTLLEDPPAIVHFAGHNEFTGESGSVIHLDGGPFQPSDLFPVRQLHTLQDRSTFVFFNACRTTGRITGLTRTEGWAEMFMTAGAGAFLGSSWAIRSDRARDFAEAFYDCFVTQRHPLGRAVQEARRRINTDDGDPTWLAYSIYGDPTATATGTS